MALGTILAALGPIQTAEAQKSKTTFVIPPSQLEKMAKQKDISTGSYTGDAVIGIGVSALNAYVGGGVAVTVGMLNDAIDKQRTLAKTALKKGNVGLKVYAIQNPGGYPALDTQKVEFVKM
ncbi:hypothetical protein [Priestia endophytica]|uniref:hypothetical protein n=1 Tax=Priestia endophytica TaxID=135735 RepID=UPI0011593CF5|nr:hypothetical protein [Priestia endophytica]